MNEKKKHNPRRNEKENAEEEGEEEGMDSFFLLFSCSGAEAESLPRQ